MEMFKDSTLEANLISAYMRSSGEGLFSTHTVGELLWGYEDGLLKALKLFRPELDDVFGLFYKVLSFFCPVKHDPNFCNSTEWNKPCFFIYRPMLQTMGSTCSSLASRATRTLLAFQHGMAKGNGLFCFLTIKVFITHFFFYSNNKCNKNRMYLKERHEWQWIFYVVSSISLWQIQRKV